MFDHTMSSRHGRRCRTIIFGVALFFVSLGSGAVRTQQVPFEGGQWAGQYELSLLDGVPLTNEIVHAMLAPPARLPGESKADRVLLGVRNVGTCDATGCALDLTNKQFGRLYRWNSRTPSNLTLIPVHPSYPQDGSQDFFCGGQTFLDNGDLIWVGGTDYKAQCEDCPNYRSFGHDAAWRLDTRTWLPSWIPASTAFNKMAYARWYPTATLLPDGTVYVHGHTAMPASGQDQFRDVLTNPLGNYAWTVASNDTWEPSCNPPTGLVGVEDYPRLHLLSTGRLFWSAAFDRSPTCCPFVYTAKPSSFLDVKQPWSCMQQRWRDGPTTNRIHINGSSLHFITWNEATQAFDETIYVIGGGEVSVSGPPDCASVIIESEVLATVEKIVNPTDSSQWDDVNVPDLNIARFNHNSTILLDGSILTSGVQAVVNGSCIFPLTAERYRTLEVFDNITPPGPGWQQLAPLAVGRQYHTSQVLLRDGRVGVFGGKNLPPTEPNYDVPDHSAEVYSPYYFFGQQRPEIDATTIQDPVLDPYPYNDDEALTFEVISTDPIDRVALIRNGASTHAFDSDQRYVELRIKQITPLGGDRYEVQVWTPVDGYMAPPGYYMLTVTATTNMPSPAEWIRLQ